MGEPAAPTTKNRHFTEGFGQCLPNLPDFAAGLDYPEPLSLLRLVAGFATGPIALGADSSWVGGTSSDWNNAANWGSGIPGASGDSTTSGIAYLSNAGIFDPTVNSEYSIGVIHGRGTLTLANTLHVFGDSGYGFTSVSGALTLTTGIIDLADSAATLVTATSGSPLDFTSVTFTGSSANLTINDSTGGVTFNGTIDASAIGVSVAAGQALNIASSGTTTVDSLTLGTGSTVDLNNGGDLTINGAATLTTGSIIDTGGVNDNSSLTFAAAGSVTHAADSIADTIDLTIDAGMLSLAGNETINNLDNSGTVDLNSIILTVSSTVTALGTISDTGGTGNLVLSNGGTHSGANTIADTVTLSVNGGTFTTVGAETIFRLNSSGTTTLGGGLTATQTSISGTLNLGSGHTHNFPFLGMNAGGILTGSGTINGDVWLSHNGQLRPGNSIGTLTADSFSFTDRATVYIEVGDSSSDKLVATSGAINFNRLTP